MSVYRQRRRSGDGKERVRWMVDGPGIASGAGIETNESDAIRVAFAGLRENRHAIDR